ncbi:MAG: hypothetical protein JO029_10050 [Candidatus Eremiobacteraeota bacterium]|nr:hypothetical protein [Candidatus Eremiobacteraeota bacterium]MBV8434608.1 hypothetical protein [Candidatus Eremiobacteraeota bacterium]MBV8722012.1 hypothetical protein [Candidatus Eremiobacteraeota bacterium]
MNVFRVGWAACAAAVLLAACSGGQGGANHPQPKATNPVAFPLFSGAEVLSSRAWQETVQSHPGAADSALLSQGAGTYDGHDVVAGTQALFPSLETWLRDLDAHPPDGYTSALEGSGVEAVRDHTRDLGIDFAVFQRTENGKQHGVVVLAVDPQTLDAKAGPMLGAIGKFKMMPQMFRDSIDSQAKKQTGFSVTELTNPNSPIGAAIAALDQLRDYGGRGVVLIDATKQ